MLRSQLRALRETFQALDEMLVCISGEMFHLQPRDISEKKHVEIQLACRNGDGLLTAAELRAGESYAELVELHGT